MKQLLENRKEDLIISKSAAQEGKKKACAQMTIGHSEMSLRIFGKSVKDMIGWRDDDDK